jgi:predicted RNase H-like nuclease (RuvC/YqgF family)
MPSTDPRPVPLHQVRQVRQGRDTGLARLSLGLCLGLSLLLALPGAALAQQDRTAERNQRRAQLQLQQAQQQLQEAQAAQAQAVTERAALEKQLAGQSRELPRMQGSLRKLGDELKAAELARTELAAQLAQRDQRLAALEQQLAGLDAQLAAQQRVAIEVQGARARDQAGFQQTLAQRQEAQLALQAQLDLQTRQGVDCSDKNGRLIRLNAELLDRYRNKGWVDSLRQGEPLLGLGEVQMFNLVQDYRDKAEAERVVAPR